MSWDGRAGSDGSAVRSVASRERKAGTALVGGSAGALSSGGFSKMLATHESTFQDGAFESGGEP